MRKIIYRDVPLYSRRIRYPWAQPNVPAWWFKKRKPTKVAQPTYRHKRTRSAAFIPGVAPPVSVYTPYRRRRHQIAAQVAVPNYKHKRIKIAAFVPNVPAYWFKKRKPFRSPTPPYKHKRTKSAAFIPGVAPPAGGPKLLIRRHHRWPIPLP